MNIKIRKGRQVDIPDVLNLIKELALFEKALPEVTNTESDMIADGFGDNPIFKMMVAVDENENQIIGIAIYFTKYSTWKGKGVYLDDIVVKESYRGQGIGTMLFDALIVDCKSINAKQLHWQVLDWNEKAINFYKKYNAELEDEWVNCKLNEVQINKFKL